MTFQIMIFQSFKSKVVGNFIDHVRMINKPTHIHTRTHTHTHTHTHKRTPLLVIDHVFIKKILMDKFSSNAMVTISYFSDNDAIRTVIKKSAVGFHFIP